MKYLEESTLVQLLKGKMEELRGPVSGELITPDDAGYDEARRTGNAAIDRTPADSHAYRPTGCAR
jgi:hypothetical protein